MNIVSKPELKTRVWTASKTAESSGKLPKPANPADATARLRASRSDIGGSKYDDVNLTDKAGKKPISDLRKVTTLE